MENVSVLDMWVSVPTDGAALTGLAIEAFPTKAEADERTDDANDILPNSFVTISVVELLGQSPDSYFELRESASTRKTFGRRPTSLRTEKRHPFIALETVSA